MNWFSVSSVDELKNLGKFRVVSKTIKDEVGDIVKIKSKGWDALYNSVLEFRGVTLRFNNNDSNVINYFTSKANEYIYCLLELDGEIRMKKLGITKKHFDNQSIAKEWMRSISKEIHPDRCNHPKAAEAMAKLNNMYNSMVGNE